jgi:hypothetical protein
MELYEARKTFLYTFLGKDYPSPILFERVLFLTNGSCLYNIPPATSNHKKGGCEEEG